MSTRAFGVMPLNPLLAEITGIREDVLYDFDKYIDQCEIEERRAWMDGRSTLRKEDAVYCQLGMFGVFMPLTYGEGDHAFVRLQEAIEQKQRRLRDNAIKSRPEAISRAVGVSIVHFRGQS